MKVTQIKKQIDYLFAKPGKPIPLRSESADNKMLDLTSHFNFGLDDDIHHKPGNTLTELPKGIQSFGGIEFDLRGLVQLEGSISLEKTSLFYAKSIQLLSINSICQTIHFLHSAAWNDVHGRKIGEYIVHYENGERISIPMIYGENLMDWWGKPEELGIEPVWKGENPRTKEIGFYIRIFKSSWENPFPALKIVSMDIVSAMSESAPIILAISLI